jgi:hypothetical protein
MWSTTNVNYLTGWASGLRDKKGLNITALAVAYVSVMLSRSVHAFRCRFAS